MAVRARDLRQAIKEQGFERGVVTTLESFLDEYTQTRQHLREVVDLLDRCIDEVQRLTTIGSNIAIKVDQMQREQRDEESGE